MSKVGSVPPSPPVPAAGEAVLKIAPRRFNATAGAAKAADKAGDQTKARAYVLELREIAGDAGTSRPELEWARVYLAGNSDNR